MIALVAEKDAVILGAQANERRFDTTKLLRVACAGAGIARRRPEDLQSDGLLDAADVGSGLFGPDDALSHSGGAFLPGAAARPSVPSPPMVSPKSARTSSCAIG